MHARELRQPGAARDRNQVPVAAGRRGRLTRDVVGAMGRNRAQLDLEGSAHLGAEVVAAQAVERQPDLPPLACDGRGLRQERSSHHAQVADAQVERATATVTLELEAPGPGTHSLADRGAQPGEAAVVRERQLAGESQAARPRRADLAGRRTAHHNVEPARPIRVDASTRGSQTQVCIASDPVRAKDHLHAHGRHRGSAEEDESRTAAFTSRYVARSPGPCGSAPINAIRWRRRATRRAASRSRCRSRRRRRAIAWSSAAAP